MFYGTGELACHMFNDLELPSFEGNEVNNMV